MGVLAERLGIQHAFGCPGDFAFAFDDAIESHPSMSFVLTTNELNAAYAADAYARVHGASVLTTTYGVGELSAINGVMGAKAERSGAVFHLVGEPGLRLQHTGRVVHHTLGAALHPEIAPFKAISESSCCVSLRVRNPGSLPRELDTVIEVALRERQPAYILVPKDIGVMSIPSNARYTSMFDSRIPRSSLKSVCHAQSVSSELDHGVAAVVKRLAGAARCAILVSYMVNRLGLEQQVTSLVEKLGCPFYTTVMDKGTLSEGHPQYGGMYKGKMSHKAVLDVVEQADCVLDIGGVLFDDLSTGFGTTALLKEKLVTLDAVSSAICLGDPSERHVQNLRVSYHGVFIGDAIQGILDSDVGPLAPSQLLEAPPSWPAVDPSETGITYNTILAAFQDALREDDTFVVEVGTISGLMSNIRLPPGCTMISQTLWGSIGAATPMTLGAALANGEPSSASAGRTLLVTGDGAHLMTANEIGTYARVDAKPIIVVINNGVYGVEEFLEKNEKRSYNDLSCWEFANAARAMIGPPADQWIIETVDTPASLVNALNKARDEGKACYIEAKMSELLLDPMSSVDLEVMYFDTPPK